MVATTWVVSCVILPLYSPFSQNVPWSTLENGSMPWPSWIFHDLPPFSMVIFHGKQLGSQPRISAKDASVLRGQSGRWAAGPPGRGAAVAGPGPLQASMETWDDIGRRAEYTSFYGDSEWSNHDMVHDCMNYRQWLIICCWEWPTGSTANQCLCHDHISPSGFVFVRLGVLFHVQSEPAEPTMVIIWWSALEYRPFMQLLSVVSIMKFCHLFSLVSPLVVHYSDHLAGAKTGCWWPWWFYHDPSSKMLLANHLHLVHAVLIYSM